MVILLTALFWLIVSLVFVLSYNKRKKICNVKYGAKFVLKTKSGNPFEWEKDEIIIIFDTKHKWVKYMDSAGRVGYISVKQLLENYKKV